MEIIEKKTPMLTDLNPDMLSEILRRSISNSRSCNGNGGGGGLRSHMRFSRVCSSWRSVAANNPYKCVPWLMLSKMSALQETRSFLALDDNQIHKIKFTEEAISSWCSGSSEGWLVMSHKTSGNFLYNPITQDRIKLPPHTKIAPQKIYKYDDDEEGSVGVLIYPESTLYLTKAIVVTSSSLSSSCSSPLANHHQHGIVAVAAILEENHNIGFCRPGDKKWQVLTHDRPSKVIYPKLNPPRGGGTTYVRFDESYFIDGIIDDDDYTAEHKELNENPMFADIILYRGAFYVITQHTALVGVFKFDTTTTSSYTTSTPRVVRRIQWLNMEPMKLRMRLEDWNYLVESCDGELLMVVRRRRDAAQSTEVGQQSVSTWRFLVFKLDESSDPMKWVRIESLGDQILFLGINHSKSIRASDIPGARSGNCIYFTTDLTWRHMTMMENLKWPNPGIPYGCNDTGVFYLEDGRVELGHPSFFTNTGDAGLSIKRYPSTVQYPALFFTPNPSHDNRSTARAARDRYSLVSYSKCWQRYAIISAIFAAGTIVILGRGLDFLKSQAPPTPLPNAGGE